MTSHSSRPSSATSVSSVSALLPGVGSVVAEETVAVLAMIVPSGTSLSTFTTRTNVAVAPAASVGLVDVTVPPELPTAGSMLFQPAGSTNDTNVVPGGITSVSVTLAASLGPLLVTVIV